MHHDNGVSRQARVKTLVDELHKHIGCDFLAGLTFPTRAQPVCLPVAGSDLVAIAAEVVKRAELARRARRGADDALDAVDFQIFLALYIRVDAILVMLMRQ